MTNLNETDSNGQTPRTFPTGFLWGAATASYQIEGAADEDGRGPSIWDTFSQTPGKVQNGDTGAVACDHYHRWPTDIALMKQLNLQAYRFSIAWPRVIPQGRGAVNQKGLDFYDRLTDGLLEAGIQPYATLYHWDLPQALQDQGGWTNRDTALAFAEYADVVSRRLGDRIAGYITHNEPWCAGVLGYYYGLHAPGQRDQAAMAKACHHLLLSHGLAVPVIRRNAPNSPVGITLNLWPVDPATPDEAAATAARLEFDRNSRLFLDPIFKAKYPDAFVQNLAPTSQIPIEPGDMEIISAPLDFLGVNYYYRIVVGADGAEVKPAGVYTTMNWEVYPEGLYNLLKLVHQDYQVPRYYITENGASGEDVPGEDGQVHDPLRRYYYQEHLAQAQRAIQEGIPLAGYFAWSLMDNFEWAWGYSRRFGLSYVDYQTQKRTIKDSGQWYSQVIQNNALPVERFKF